VIHRALGFLFHPTRLRLLAVELVFSVEGSLSLGSGSSKPGLNVSFLHYPRDPRCLQLMKLGREKHLHVSVTHQRESDDAKPYVSDSVGF